MTTLLAMGVLWVGAAVHVLNDAQKRRVPNAWLWGLGTLVSGPVAIIAYQAGDTLTTFAVSGGKLLGEAKIVRSATEGTVDSAHPDRPAPQLLLTLARPLLEIEQGDLT